jgi:protein suppressor of PHYA-105 1
VGLGVLPKGYMVCGSEDNSTYAYYRALPDPIARQSFGNGMRSSIMDPQGEQSVFVSTICTSRKGSLIIAANSVGTVKVLELT